jgi:hypothetical protein
MHAIQGVYNRGELKLNTKPPKNYSNVIVVFTDEIPAKNEKMPMEEALRILDKHAGSIKGEINIREERLAYLDERYGNPY